MRKSPYKILEVDTEASAPVIEAAYKVLRRRQLPEGREATARWRSEVEWAYSVLRNPASRHGYDRDVRWGRLRPVGPGVTAEDRPAPETTFPVYLESGPYAGWMLTDVAAHDPAYLEWLSDQPAGAPHRAAITLALQRPPGHRR